MCAETVAGDVDGRPRNLVWLTVESTRFDHTTLGGYHRDTTPNLDRIAASARARSFDRCFSHGIWTRASTASILTGTYPRFHGTGMDSEVLPDSIPTVPERLGECGYDTICLSPNPHLSAATGLDRGFDEFVFLDRASLPEVAGYRKLVTYLLQLRRHSGGFTRNTRVHSTGYLLEAGIEQRLRTAREPTFLYAHFGDPHHPYVPPLPYLDRYTDDLPISGHEAREIALDMSTNMLEYVAASEPFSDVEWQALEAMYDASLAYTDQRIGDVYDFVRTNMEDTVLVVTGDHGELFGERGLLAHRLTTHDAVCHVPLVVAGPTSLLDYEGHVQHADVVYTLLSELDCSTDGLQGRDLRYTSREWSVVQRGGSRTADTLQELRRIDPSYDDDPVQRGTLTAIRGDEYKFESSDASDRLYDLPDETTDVADACPERLEAFREREATFRNRIPERTGGGRDAEFTDHMTSRLRTMGYLTE